jgi:hypothetical protein
LLAESRRFTSVDPLTASATIRNPQTFNRYAYALNSPYKFTDPLGLIPSSTGACGGWCPGGDSGLFGSGGGHDSSSADYFESAAIAAALAQADRHTNEAAQPSDGTPAGHQASQQADPPASTTSPGCGGADKQVEDKDLQKIDSDLAATFTDTGIVRGASSFRNVSVAIDGNPTDSHYMLKDGKLHTIHIYANESANSDNANVYIPTDFSDVKITSKDTVVARNPKTGEVILIAHVQVGSGSKGMKRLKKNMKIVRSNGTMLIGKIGGRGGGMEDSPCYIHSHLSFFPSESSRLRAIIYKTKNYDYGSLISTDLSDLRRFAK